VIESRIAGRSYDVLVLGGGAASCTLAARLSEDPERSVCLVEAGPDYGHYEEGRWPVDILDARWLALDSRRSSVSASQLSPLGR
jgi:choline dehydrogenase